MTASGRVAFLTNYREGLSPEQTRQEPRSRGELVTGFLQSSESPMEYAEGLDCSQYQDFNLVVGDVSTGELVYINSVEREPKLLPPGIHGFSNGPMGSASWPKVDEGKRRLAQLLAAPGHRGGVELDDVVRDVLSSTEKADLASLPSSGFTSQEFERRLSSIFVEEQTIRGAPYGTRCQTAIAVRPEGSAALLERFRHPSGEWTQATHELELPRARSLPGSCSAGPTGGG